VPKMLEKKTIHNSRIHARIFNRSARDIPTSISPLP
jgi:hypothetical protein